MKEWRFSEHFIMLLSKNNYRVWDFFLVLLSSFVNRDTHLFTLRIIFRYKNLKKKKKKYIFVNLFNLNIYFCFFDNYNPHAIFLNFIIQLIILYAIKQISIGSDNSFKHGSTDSIAFGHKCSATLSLCQLLSSVKIPTFSNQHFM